MLDVKKLIAKILKQPTVKCQLVQASINKAFGNHVAVNAPTIDGYNFLCWAQVATIGWVGSVYPSAPQSINCDMWNATTGQSGTGTIDCLALYVPKTT